MSYWHIGSIRSGDFEAERPWHLPGIRCQVCGTWSTFGPALPSVSLAGHPMESEFRLATAYLPRWRTLRDALRPLLPADQPLVPGLGLGLLSGRIVVPFEIGWLGGGWS